MGHGKLFDGKNVTSMAMLTILCGLVTSTGRRSRLVFEKLLSVENFKRQHSSSREEGIEAAVGVEAAAKQYNISVMDGTGLRKKVETPIQQ